MSAAGYDLNTVSFREPTPKRHVAQIPLYVTVPEILTSRSLGFHNRPIGFTDAVKASVYSSFDSVAIDPDSRKSDNYWGGIFNFEFSHNGKLLVAACEGKQVLIYDAGNQKKIETIETAHLNCVNCIKFLDERTFATGSDDALIKLWDIRKLDKCMKTLHGHSSWVKNIEWSEEEHVMVTSAFDGTVYAWNLNDRTENNMLFEKVFLLSGLMRMKLTPDGKKMLITTTAGFMIIIHNLNLLTLALDLRSFRPNLYRLMQTSEQCFPVATTYNYLFDPKRTRNRIEFIDDFPNESEVISSLQIHPHGWAAVSRNLNSEENEEWTAVHDIQDRDAKDYEDSFMYTEDCVDEYTFDTPSNDESADRVHQRPTDLWLGYTLLEDYNALETTAGTTRQEMGIVSSGLIGSSAPYNAYFQNHPDERNKVILNLKRMTHYIKEKNVGKGFIKEVAISPDGRVICSPYDRGIRLLAFNQSCQEMSECVLDEPKELHPIVEMNDYHRDVVVSCKFNPMHYQLVSGCLGSQINWYQPVL
ncbi:uncharacterized protein LOC126739320 [Anthonomus grandis grandis]|uniref:uncharacterized protein LOC126739320 n=1 Tax=Anthonomus grandis grandis TaxID=2921223 RepID=UPI002165185F|nr:uncharacterized protein LOC126739320 [Anthonomus grandis grandis]